RATSVQVQPDGSILVGGTDDYLSSFAPGSGIAAALDPRGVVSYMSYTDGVFFTPSAVQVDGKTVVAMNNLSHFVVQRYNTDGSLDTSFGNAGTKRVDFGDTSDEKATAVAVQPDGKIVVAGYSYQGGSAGYVFAVARLYGFDPTPVGTPGNDTITVGS